jgi:ABC-2 type transport system permease protein
VLALAVGVLCFTSLGIAASTFVPNQEAAGPIVNIVFFVLLFVSGLWYPLRSGSALARVGDYFPVRHLITAVFAPFDARPGVSPWAWNDLLTMAIWGVVAGYVALRRFRFEPSRSQ